MPLRQPGVRNQARLATESSSLLPQILTSLIVLELQLRPSGHTWTQKMHYISLLEKEVQSEKKQPVKELPQGKNYHQHRESFESPKLGLYLQRGQKTVYVISMK